MRVRTGAVPRAERLAILPDAPDVRDVRAGQRDLLAVAANAPLLPVRSRDDQKAIQIDVGRVLQNDDLALAIRYGLEPDAVEFPVRRAGAVEDGGNDAGGERGEKIGVLRPDPAFGKRRPTIGS